MNAKKPSNNNTICRANKVFKVCIRKGHKDQQDQHKQKIARVKCAFEEEDGWEETNETQRAQQVYNTEGV